MSTLSRLRRSASVGHTLQSVPATVIPGLCSGLGAVAIGRLTGDATLGLVSLAIVTANFGAATVSQATSSLALRTVAAGADHAADEYRLASLRRGIVVGLCAALAGAVAWALGSTAGPVLILGALWIPVQALILFDTELLRASHRFGAASAWLSARAVLAWSAGVWAAWAFGASASVAVQLGASLLIALALCGPKPWPRLTDTHRGELRQVGRPITHQALASYALGYADRYVVQILRGPAAVGLYSIGYVLGQGVVEVAMTPITAALSPRIIREVADGDAPVVRRTIRNGALALLGLGALAVVGIAVADALGLLDLLTPKGASTQELAIVSVLVALATVLQGIVRLAYAVLLAHRDTRSAARSFLITLGLAAVAIPVATWFAGVIGAAAVTLASTAVLASLMTWYARRSMEAPSPDARVAP